MARRLAFVTRRPRAVLIVAVLLAREVVSYWASGRLPQLRSDDGDRK